MTRLSGFGEVLLIYAHKVNFQIYILNPIVPNMYSIPHMLHAYITITCKIKLSKSTAGLL